MLAKFKEAEIKRLLGGRDPNSAVVTAGPTGAYIRKSYKTNNYSNYWLVTHGCYQVRMSHIQVQTAPRKILAIRIQKQPRTTSWGATLNLGPKISLMRWARSDKLY
jgi:hypothetical protein